MRLQHLRDIRGFRRGRRRTSPRSSASTMGSWDIIHLNSPGRKVREKLLVQRKHHLSRRKRSRLMMVVP